MDNNTFNYENRIVAFIDILGFKEIVERSARDNSVLSKLYSALNTFKSKENIQEEWGLDLMEIEEDAQKKGVGTFDIRNSVRVTCFSDSIVISATYTEEDIHQVVSSLIGHISFLGAKLLSEGILLRGGMANGQLYHDQHGTVVGKGMIDAYLIESNLAKMPRIVLSPQLIKKLNYPLERKADRYPYHQYVKRFGDGIVGFTQLEVLCVLQSSSLLTNEQLKKDLELIRKEIIAGLDENMANPSVYEKYNWLKNEYNELIILDEGIKKRLPNLNEEITGHNIHFSETDRSINR